MVGWTELYLRATEEYGAVSNIEDVKKVFLIMLKYLNATSGVKTFLKDKWLPYVLRHYTHINNIKSSIAATLQFIQYLSIKKGKRIGIKDFKDVSDNDAFYFLNEYTTTGSVRKRVGDLIITFFRFLVYEDVIYKYPFKEFVSKKPLKSQESLAEKKYTYDELEEFYNVVLANPPKPDYTLFFRLLIQTGQRPSHIFYISCGDITDKIVVDALGRKFVKIPLLTILSRERSKIGIPLSEIKKPAEWVYISKSLANDLVNYCRSHGYNADDLVFKDVTSSNFLLWFIYRRTNYLKNRYESLKSAGAPESELKKYVLKRNYTPYGLRHTWTSVLWALTRDKHLIEELGGWGKDTETYLKVYTHLTEICDALKIVKKWEIYIPSVKEVEIKDIERKCMEGVSPPSPGMPSQIETASSRLEEELRAERQARKQLEQELEFLKKQMEELRELLTKKRS